MSDNGKNTINIGGSGGIGLGSLLTIIFLVLKLCGVIAWEWIYVFLPIIISFGLYLLILIVTIVIACVGYKRGWWD